MIQLLMCLEYSNLLDHQIKEMIIEDNDEIFRYLLKGNMLMDDNALLLPMLRRFLDGNPRGLRDVLSIWRSGNFGKDSLCMFFSIL